MTATPGFPASTAPPAGTRSAVGLSGPPMGCDRETVTGRMSRLLTDRRFGTKIRLAVMAVAAVCVVDESFALISLGRINAQ